VSHYDVLRTRPDADADQLRRAFVSLARRYHPDRHVHADPATRREAERRMREITEAWAVLGDPDRRRRYDQGLGDRARTPGSAGATSRGSAPGGGGPSAGPAGPQNEGADGAGPRDRRTAQARSASAGGATSSDSGDWRRYASPGSAGHGHRPAGEQLLLMSPVILVVVGLGFGLLGGIVGWPPFFAMALLCLIGAATAFFMVPIWAMTRGSARRGGRGPKRSY
jgi:curved DNA-binding protein CbpA